jgi:serine/threonine-protein kinase
LQRTFGDEMPGATEDAEIIAAGGLGHSGARAVGDHVGRYVLRSLLGEGSMGSVWVADDALLAIPVALKVLRDDSLARHGAERLLREARAVAQLKHPAIVQVFDYGVSPEGDAYLVLELLDGQTLTALAANEQLAPETVVGLMLPILDALAMAHDHGIVHRDIKPDNLFVTMDDRGHLHPKVLDFGIAKSPVVERARLTMSGSMIGTPAYMSPEQVRGQSDIDARADLWALSATMYELLAGFVPFDGASVPQLLTAVLEREPRSLAGIPGVDAELAAIVARGLAKDRSLRWEDARSMGRALAAWLVEREIAVDACGTSLRSAWLAPVVRDDSGARRLPTAPPLSLRRSGADLAGTLAAGGGPTLQAVVVAMPPSRRPLKALVAAMAIAAASLIAVVGVVAWSSSGVVASRVVLRTVAASAVAAVPFVPPTDAPPPTTSAAEPPAPTPSASAAASIPSSASRGPTRPRRRPWY